MSTIVQVSNYESPGPDLGFVSLGLRVDEIAERTGLRVETWEEDGLGPACGMFVKLPSETVVLLRDLKHAVEHLGQRGPTVYTTADRLSALEVGLLVTEVLESLGLPQGTAYWIASESLQQTAAELAARAERISKPRH